MNTQTKRRNPFNSFLERNLASCRYVACRGRSRQMATLGADVTFLNSLSAMPLCIVPILHRAGNQGRCVAMKVPLVPLTTVFSSHTGAVE